MTNGIRPANIDQLIAIIKESFQQLVLELPVERAQLDVKLN